MAEIKVAMISSTVRDLKKALEFALEALAVRRELFGDQHPETLAVVVDVVSIYCDSARVHSGFQLLDEYLKKIPKNHSHYEWLKKKNRDFHSRYFLPGFRQPPKRRR